MSEDGEKEGDGKDSDKGKKKDKDEPEDFVMVCSAGVQEDKRTKVEWKCSVCNGLFYSDAEFFSHRPCNG